MSDETTNATNDVLKQVFDEGHAMGRTAGYTCGHIDGLMHAAREAIEVGAKATDEHVRLAASDLAERFLTTARELIGQARNAAEGGAK